MPVGSPDSGCTVCSKEVEEGYTVIKTLGKGRFTEVKEVQQKGTRKHFAWKQVQLDKDPCCDLQIQLLRRVQHNNILRLYEVYWAAGVMDIMLELCSGTMADCIASHRDTSGSYRTPSRTEVAESLSQLLMAVNFLHENQVAHRNIKPCNVLLSSKRTWKLANFNLACGFDPGHHMSERVGSLPYRAPEIDQREYTEKCDIYSTGVLFIAFVRGKEYVRPLLEDIKGSKGTEAEELLNEKTWTSTVGSGALSLAKHMISLEEARCDAEEALRNPWLMQNLGSRAGLCCVVS